MVEHPKSVNPTQVRPVNKFETECVGKSESNSTNLTGDPSTVRALRHHPHGFRQAEPTATATRGVSITILVAVAESPLRARVQTAQRCLQGLRQKLNLHKEQSIGQNKYKEINFI